MLNKGHKYLIYDKDDDGSNLDKINQIMFFVMNWMFLFANIWMLYMIRHINDKLSIREEMAKVVAVWTFFCLLQYILYVFSQIAQ